MTHLEGNPKHPSSLKTSQQPERSYPHASDVAYSSATGHNPQSFGHPMQDLGSGAMATNALSHSGPPALARPSTIYRFDQNPNPHAAIPSRNQHIDDTSSVISFTSSVHSLNYDSASITNNSGGFQNTHGTGLSRHGSASRRVEGHNSQDHQNHPLALLTTCTDIDKLSRDLVAMSSSPANLARMRTGPVIASMVQLLHQSHEQPNKCDASTSSSALKDRLRNKQSREIRSRISHALHNMVNIHNPNDRPHKKEGKVLKLLDQLRMYTDFLIDLTLSLEESDKEQCLSPGSTNDEVERSLNNIEQESQKSSATRMEKTDSGSNIPNQEKERMIEFLGNCSAIKIGTIRNLNSPTGKDLIVLCDTNPTTNIKPEQLIFKFPCRNFINYQFEPSFGIQAAAGGSGDDDDRDVDSGIISMEDYAPYANMVDEHYRKTLLSKFLDLQNFWITLKIEETVAWLTKWSFDEGHRQPIELLGGIPALAEFAQVEFKAHQNICSYLQRNVRCDNSNKTCNEVRRFAVVALTNMTFGKANIKSFLCTYPDFVRLMVCQLRNRDKTAQTLSCQLHFESRNSPPKSSVENLRKATAHLFRNLAWKADKNSKQILSDSEVVGVLLKSAIDVTIAAVSVAEKCDTSTHAIFSSKVTTLPKQIEPFLKVILSALWNLSAHCRKNKCDICDMEGGLQFLVFLLRQSQAEPIIESSGGILRNISSFIATSPNSENYRNILRQSGCLETLLVQLRSSSLTIVSNACGTLWNFSARNVDDQSQLWSLGAVPMLESLTNSKHKTISTCSLAALKNLYGFKNKESEDKSFEAVFQNTDSLKENDTSTSNSQGTLEKRKRKNKAKEMDEKLKLTHQPQVQDDDKDSCTSDDSDAGCWNIRSPTDDILKGDGSQGGISSRLSNISASNSHVSASNIARASSHISNQETEVHTNQTYLPSDHNNDPRAYNASTHGMMINFREEYRQEDVRSPSFSIPSPPLSSRLSSPGMGNNPLKQRQFDGRFTNYMKQYQPQTQSEIPVMTSATNQHQQNVTQNVFTAPMHPQNSSFNELLSPSRLPHLSFNATTSSPLYLSQGNMQQNESFGNRALDDETGDECLDERPTDYSLRFQENEETEFQGRPGNSHQEQDCRIQSGNNQAFNIDEDEQEPNVRGLDDVKTYCIEGTPYDTPCVISHAGSETDLRDIHSNRSDSEEEEEMPNITSCANPMSGMNPYENRNIQDCDDDLEDDSESNRPKVFCTEDTPGVFSRADSISSLSSGGDDLFPTELERQKVIERGRSIPAPGEAVSSKPITVNDAQLELEKGEIETNNFSEKDKSSDNIGCNVNHGESLTPPLPSHPSKNNQDRNNEVDEFKHLDARSNIQSSNMTPQNADYNNQIHQNKHVKFNPQETPLMYSRASSPESLASCDIQDGYKDVYSSYEQSRATSGRVSPSDLPDSPCQSRPRSPPKPHPSNKKPQKTMRVMPSCSFPTNTPFPIQNTSNNTAKLHGNTENRPKEEKAMVTNNSRPYAYNKVSQHAIQETNQEEECDEREEVKCYVDEGETPAACFSPLSRLTFSDDDKEGQKQGELSNHNSSRLKVKFSNLSLISYKKVFQSVFMKI